MRQTGQEARREAGGTATALRATPARLSILMPVYNERETIREALQRVRAVPVEKEIIVVDDASTDGTTGILEQEPEITLIKHADNQGKGAAIRTALQAVTGDVVVIQDADLEYDPGEIPQLVEPIARGECRVVYGSRFLRGRPRMRWANYVCNRLLALAANVLYGARITDEATCYKAFEARLICSLPLQCRRFEFCPEVTAKVRLRGERIQEVPISYDARTEDAGKKIRWWDAVSAFWTLFRCRFSR
jgi:glycosyltransferase involved in cell wall biosynthesis